MTQEYRDFTDRCRSVGLVELLDIIFTEKHPTRKRIAETILGDRLSQVPRRTKGVTQ